MNLAMGGEYHVLMADLEHIQHGHHPNLQVVAQTSTKTESSKHYSTYLSNQIPQDDREHAKTSKFHNHKPTITFYLL